MKIPILKQNRIHVWLILISFPFILSLAVVFFTVSLSTAAPVTWTPNRVAQTVIAGEENTVGVSFTSKKNLRNVEILISSELRTFVTAIPSSFSTIRKGEVVTLKLRIAPPLDMLPDSIDGTLHLIRIKKLGQENFDKDDNGEESDSDDNDSDTNKDIKKNVSKPLPVVITIWATIKEKGLVLNHPSGWQLNEGPLLLGGPIALNNFSSKYETGGIIPESGAEIDIARIQLPSSPLNDLINEELQGAEIESSQTVTVNGISGTKILYTDPFTSNLVYRNIVIYVSHGTYLYKFFLSYRAGDPFENQHIADFQDMIDTVRFVE